MRHVLAALAAAAAAVSPSHVRADFTWMPGKSARIDALIARRHLGPYDESRLHGPALSLAVSIDGAVVVAKGYGEAAPGVAADADTVYHVGSLTKQFTAAAILNLLEAGARAPITNGVLALDTPVRDLFLDVERWEPGDQPPMTVGSLLTMTSNLPNFTRRPPPDADPWGMIPAPRLLEELKKLTPSGWPRSFEYSNTSYFLLAQIIEAVTVDAGPGRAGYRNTLRTFFSKAGMRNAGFVGDYASGAHVAVPTYRRRPAFAQPDWLKGSGDMAASAADLAAWHAALMTGTAVTPAAREAMLSEAARVGPTEYYGMGWFVSAQDGLQVYRHGGSVPGYTSFNTIVRSADQRSWVSVVILTSSDGVEGLDELADDIVDLARAP